MGVHKWKQLGLIRLPKDPIIHDLKRDSNPIIKQKFIAKCWFRRLYIAILVCSYIENVWIYATCFRSDTDVNGLVQERRNSIANSQELRLSCTNPSI